MPMPAIALMALIPARRGTLVDPIDRGSPAGQLQGLRNYAALLSIFGGSRSVSRYTPGDYRPMVSSASPTPERIWI